MSGGDAGSGQESQLHQAQSLIFRQIQTVQDAVFATAEFGKSSRPRSVMAALTFDTELHYSFSMKLKVCVVKVMEIFDSCYKRQSVAINAAKDRG